MADIKDYKRAKANIRKRLNVEHIFNETSIFNYHNHGGNPLDKATVDHIKGQFELWFNSWVADDLAAISE